MFEILQRESVYLWFYLTIVFQQIVKYWVIGVLIGSILSVAGKEKIHGLVDGLSGKNLGILGIVPASVLGAVSPLCMYGTIPVAAASANKGMREDWLAAFMTSSVLLNPQLMVYSLALGKTVFLIRIVTCVAMGILAGFLVSILCEKKKFFNFTGFTIKTGSDVSTNLLLRLLKNIWRNIMSTGPYFFAGIILTVLFQRYVPKGSFISLFGSNHRLGVLMASALGVPLYLCGGGTIPLLRDWLWRGMSVGGAAAFMITGPATKFTNLTALKTVLGARNFVFFILFSICYATIIGFLCNLFF